MRFPDDVRPGLWHYAHSGVRISSELELPEWSQCEQPESGASPDVVIRLATSSRSGIQPVAPQRLITPMEFRLRVPDVGSLRVRGGRDILVRLLPTADRAAMRPWLFGPAWGALCYQRGFLLIHASAVQIENEAVLFCGPAGHGKSTLAVQLSTRGYPLVSDDLCRVDFSPEGRPVVYPAPPRVKLWSDSLAALGWGCKDFAPDLLRPGKFHFSLSEHGAQGMGTPSGMGQTLPVRVAYMLGWGELGVNRLRGLTAFERFFRGATYRMRMLELMDQLGPHSQRCMEFLRHVPLLELSRPRDFSSSGGIIDILTARDSHVRV